jgi:hypothetical protein
MVMVAIFGEKSSIADFLFVQNEMSHFVRDWTRERGFSSSSLMYATSVNILRE